MSQISESSISVLIAQAAETLSRIEKRQELERLLALYEKRYGEERRPQEKELIRKKIKETEDRIERFCLEGGSGT